MQIIITLVLQMREFYKYGKLIGCTIAFLLLVNLVNAQSKIVLKCFPNPVSDNSITVQISKDGRTAGSFEVYNLLGRQVYQKRIDASIEAVIVPIDDFPKGFYIVKYFDDNSIIAVKTFQRA